MSSKTPHTLKIEELIKSGASLSSISRDTGVSRQRVQQINKRLLNELDNTPATCTQEGMQEVRQLTLKRKPIRSCDLENIVPTSTLTIQLSPRIKEALNTAVLRCNRGLEDEDDVVTPNEYVEQVLMGHLAELGLLKRK